jgi:hypothetical protein
MSTYKRTDDANARTRTEQTECNYYKKSCQSVGGMDVRDGTHELQGSTLGLLLATQLEAKRESEQLGKEND